MKKKLLLLTAFAFLVDLSLLQSAYGQGKWMIGEIITNEGKKMTGNIYYDTADNKVYLMQADGDNLGLGPQYVQSFKYVDELAGKERVFYSLSHFYKSGIYMSQGFYEVLFEKCGLILLSLTVEKYQQLSFNDPSNPQFTYYTSKTYRVAEGSTYIGDSTGTNFIKLLPNSRISKELIQKITGEKFDLLKKYASKNGYKFNNQKELVRILEYYCTLKKETETLKIREVK